MIYITWLNYLGGFDYWLFTGWSDKNIEVSETGETKKNVFAGWPRSYGAFADTVTKQTFRRTKKSLVIRTRLLSRTQCELIGEQIKSSILVQMVDSRSDKRTVIVDSDSIVVSRDMNKIHNLSFTITYTDDYPTQHV